MHFGFKELLTAGGPILFALAALSVYSIAVILERWSYFRKTTAEADAIVKKVMPLVRAGDPDKAALACKNSSNPAAKILEAALQAGGSRGERTEFAASAVEYNTSLFRRRLTVLATIGSTTPFIGLLGTVVGVMRAFKDLAAYAGAGPSIVASGIAEALVNTAAGLFVAIPAIVAYNYFISRANAFSERMQWTCTDIINRTQELNADRYVSR